MTRAVDPERRAARFIALEEHESTHHRLVWGMRHHRDQALAGLDRYRGFEHGDSWSWDTLPLNFRMEYKQGVEAPRCRHVIDSFLIADACPRRLEDVGDGYP